MIMLVYASLEEGWILLKLVWRLREHRSPGFFITATGRAQFSFIDVANPRLRSPNLIRTCGFTRGARTPLRRNRDFESSHATQCPGLFLPFARLRRHSWHSALTRHSWILPPSQGLNTTRRKLIGLQCGEERTQRGGLVPLVSITFTLRSHS